MTDLVAAGLAKRFGHHTVLSDIDLHVAAGTLTTLLGASGSGKTTLLRLLCGFERPDAGTIVLGDNVVAGPGVHMPPERRRIGYVAQDGALFPHLSVAENIVFGLPRRERASRTVVDRLIGLLGLKPSHAGRRPHQLSGGEQQRVALARALAAQPRIVLLDEPFSSLDAALRVDTRRAVSDALAEVGATALLVTHDQAEALSLGERVAVLRNGRMVQVDAPGILYRRPHDLELARFIGEAVVLPGVAVGDHVSCALGVLRLAVDMPRGQVDVMIRPEQIRVLEGGEPGGVRARICGVTFYGHDASVAMILDNDPAAKITARTPGHVPVRAGDQVRLAVAGEVVSYVRDAASRSGAARATAPAADASVSQFVVSARVAGTFQRRR